MRLQELFSNTRLNETTEEDRAIISLSSAIYAKLQEYAYSDEDGVIHVGKIGDLFNTSIPALDDINIDIESDDGIMNRIDSDNTERDPYTEYVSGVYEAPTNTIIFNRDHLNSNNMKTTITHELRHALDDKKSNYKAGTSKKYFPVDADRETSMAHNKQPNADQTRDAQPGEINARFAEVLHSLVPAIRRAYALPSDQIKARLLSDLKKNLNIKQISNLFPEKEKSPDYKRLIKRAMDMLQKEMSHHEAELAKQGKPKVATGNW